MNRLTLYAGEPGATTHGTTFTFTGSAWVHAEDADDDSPNDALIADHLMVGIPDSPRRLDKQTHEIIYKDIGKKDPDVPFLWEFTTLASSVQRSIMSSKAAYCGIHDRLKAGI